ncbi:hypothetical protein OE88DRAFT_368822 [Heliocybe sulcata]|uniref:Uncharacterized protein n=1 Tax=Heliocybe sulcata TaxID=5364 RepID=A0A5C3N7C5_9AGAM|nr:hypothetical protein OE88DRAFT_368822 [Heliocybe sulcata]
MVWDGRDHNVIYVVDVPWLSVFIMSSVLEVAATRSRYCTTHTTIFHVNAFSQSSHQLLMDCIAFGLWFFGLFALQYIFTGTLHARASLLFTLVRLVDEYPCYLSAPASTLTPCLLLLLVSFHDLLFPAWLRKRIYIV